MSGEHPGFEATHRVIVNEHKHFVVWPMGDRLPLGWRDMGREGTKSELESYLQQMAIETRPTPLLITDRRSLDTVWD
jgi:MbtH protein